MKRYTFVILPAIKSHELFLLFCINWIIIQIVVRRVIVGVYKWYEYQTVARHVPAGDALVTDYGKWWWNKSYLL